MSPEAVLVSSLNIPCVPRAAVRSPSPPTEFENRHPLHVVHVLDIANSLGELDAKIAFSEQCGQIKIFERYWPTSRPFYALHIVFQTKEAAEIALKFSVIVKSHRRSWLYTCLEALPGRQRASRRQKRNIPISDTNAQLLVEKETLPTLEDLIDDNASDLVPQSLPSYSPAELNLSFLMDLEPLGYNKSSTRTEPASSIATARIKNNTKPFFSQHLLPLSSQTQEPFRLDRRTDNCLSPICPSPSSVSSDDNGSSAAGYCEDIKYFKFHPTRELPSLSEPRPISPDLRLASHVPTYLPIARARTRSTPERPFASASRTTRRKSSLDGICLFKENTLNGNTNSPDELHVYDSSAIQPTAKSSSKAPETPSRALANTLANKPRLTPQLSNTDQFQLTPYRYRSSTQPWPDASMLQTYKTLTLYSPASAYLDPANRNRSSSTPIMKFPRSLVKSSPPNDDDPWEMGVSDSELEELEEVFFWIR